MGAFRNGTTAHLPENFPTPSSTEKVDLDWPPMTGSLVTCHLWSVAEPSKVASTTGDCAESAGASREGEREAHVQTAARREGRERGAVWVWAYPGREGERREGRREHLVGSSGWDTEVPERCVLCKLGARDRSGGGVALQRTTRIYDTWSSLKSIASRI